MAVNNSINRLLHQQFPRMKNMRLQGVRPKQYKNLPLLNDSNHVVLEKTDFAFKERVRDKAFREAIQTCEENMDRLN